MRLCCLRHKLGWICWHEDHEDHVTFLWPTSKSWEACPVLNLPSLSNSVSRAYQRKSSQRCYAHAWMMMRTLPICQIWRICQRFCSQPWTPKHPHPWDRPRWCWSRDLAEASSTAVEDSAESEAGSWRPTMGRPAVSLECKQASKQADKQKTNK